MLKIFLIFSIGIILSCAAEKIRYDNYSLFKIIPSSVNDIEILKNLQNSDLRYDFWTEPTPNKNFVSVISRPEYKGELEGLLNANGIKFEITMPNIQEAIDKETPKVYTRGNLKSMTWDAYYNNEQISDWLDDLGATYPDIVTVLVIGTSYEGRPLKGVKISHGGTDKRVIFLEGGIHAREWISPATVCFITNELLTSEDELTMAAVREYDWYIFPVVNPDGYAFSHETNRLWRKNRRPFGSAFGVDLNRNWNNNWLVIGASTSPSSDVYAGPGPFSEPETLQLSRFMSSIGDKMDIYINFHSYGQMLIIPFGNTTEHLGNYYEALNIGRRAMGALSVRYGTQYVTGNSGEVIYLASGAADDWVKERINPPLAYCYELRDLGVHGFLLPEEQIRPTGEETIDSVLELIHQGRRFKLFPGPLAESGASGLKASVFVVVMMIAKIFI